MPKFTVLVTTEKTITVIAADEDEARERAEERLGPTWSAEDAWPFKQ